MCTGVTPQSINSMKSLASLVAATAIALPGLIVSPSKAADYCMTTTKNDRMCIHGTYGPRGRRKMVISQNGGAAYSYIYDCYNDNYQSTSIIAVGCWDYAAISTEPPNLPEVAEKSSQVRAILSSSGSISSEMGIDLEKVRNAMPSEMK